MNYVAVGDVVTVKSDVRCFKVERVIDGSGEDLPVVALCVANARHELRSSLDNYVVAGTEDVGEGQHGNLVAGVGDVHRGLGDVGEVRISFDLAEVRRVAEPEELLVDGALGEELLTRRDVGFTQAVRSDLGGREFVPELYHG